MERIQQKGDGAVIHAFVQLESGCSIEQGEFDVEFTGMSQSVTMRDFELARECIFDHIDELGLKEETYAKITLREDGEREDVFWNKYYVIEKFSIHELA